MHVKVDWICKCTLDFMERWHVVQKERGRERERDHRALRLRPLGHFGLNTALEPGLFCSVPCCMLETVQPLIFFGLAQCSLSSFCSALHCDNALMSKSLVLAYLCSSWKLRATRTLKGFAVREARCFATSQKSRVTSLPRRLPVA